jgi:hypothetical protein
MIARGALLVGLAAAATARADAPAGPSPPAAAGAPDPAVAEAADANLESTSPRSGLTLSLSGGGGLTVGFGIDDSVGRGGSGSLRLGRYTSDRTLLTVEATGTAVLHTPGPDSSAKANTVSELLAGVQRYANPSLWLRFAGGLGAYQRRSVLLDNGTIGNTTTLGPAILGGAGVEIARYHWAVLDIELQTSAVITLDGVLFASGLGFGVTLD